MVFAGGENVAARIKASTARIDSKSDAERAFIELGKAQLPSSPEAIRDRAIAYALGDAIQAQENREQILRHAADDIASKPPPEDAPQELDEDWLNTFRRYSETKSNADIQHLWGKILAAEIRRPGATSLRTLGFLSTISSDEANFVVSIFKFVINGGAIPSWFMNPAEKIEYPAFLKLVDLGLAVDLPNAFGSQYNVEAKRVMIGTRAANVVTLSYFGKAILFLSADKLFKISIPVVPLTGIAMELFRISDTIQPDYPLIEEFARATRPPDCERVLICDLDPTGTKLSNEKVLFENDHEER